MGRVLGASAGATVLNQDIYAISATRKHRLGTRVVIGNRVFVYAKAGNTLNAELLVHTHNFQHMGYNAIAADQAAGLNTLTVTSTTADGVEGDGAIAAHELEGGFLTIHTHTANNQLNMAIVDNTVVTASSHTMTITTDGEIPIALTTSFGIECMASPYLNVRYGDDPNRSFVGLPMRKATALIPYVWLQTWGPCWVTPANGYGEHNPGSTANSYQLVAFHEGSVAISADEDADTEWAQNVGFVLTKTETHGQAAPFIMLQISP